MTLSEVDEQLIEELRHLGVELFETDVVESVLNFESARQVVIIDVLLDFFNGKNGVDEKWFQMLETMLEELDAEIAITGTPANVQTPQYQSQGL